MSAVITQELSADSLYYSNEANMQLIEQMGIFPDRYIREKRPSLRSVVHTLIAGIRIRLVLTFPLFLLKIMY